MNTGRNEESTQPLLEPLTRREHEILDLLAEGLTSGEMAERLTLAVSSVRWYVQQIYGKLGVNSKRQAIARASQLGLVPSVTSTLAGISGPDIAEKSLPTGTVTFLFTDIEGSTPLWESQPQLMAEATRVHNAALRQAIEANGGVVFKTVGDAFQAAFNTAPQALKAAIEGQRALQIAAWNALGPLKVRMGVHTGEVGLDPGGDEYAVSHTKNRVARIMSAAYGGQVLLSQECADLVRRSLPEGVVLKDMGEHNLKGMSFLEHLYQACAQGLPQSFPPLASSVTHLNNLPVQLTSFIGRETEITALRQFITVDLNRLVTLTGSGGVGKTRLAIRVAEELLDNFEDGIWLVELAPLTDPGLVAKAAVTALGLLQTYGQSAAQALCDYLHNKRLLLILDNCEHVVSAAAELADMLLRACSKLSILATSREILGVSSEVPFRVPSLSLPVSHNSLAIGQLVNSDAVRLFVERAAQVSPEFALNDSNANGVAFICQRLDGIPLAIELATARLRVLTVTQIATRLGDVFRLLTTGSRNAMPRQQTLKAAIDWSYDLLTQPERKVLQRLSIFTGSWTLEAAEAVCSDPPLKENVKHSSVSIQRAEVFDMLSELVDKSLIFPIVTNEGINRYLMLETIRQYAHEKLVEAGEAEAIKDQHLAYYVELAEQAQSHLRGKGQVEWLNLMEEELGNLRLALEWSLPRAVEAGLVIASDLLWFWHLHSHVQESTDWLEKLISAKSTEYRNHPPDREQSLVLARAVTTLGWLGQWHFYSMSSDAMLVLQKENVRRLRKMDHPPARDLGLALMSYIDTDIQLTDKERAPILDECMALFKLADDQVLQNDILQELSSIDLSNGNSTGFLEKMERRLAFWRGNGDVDGIAFALEQLGSYWFEQGNPEKAEKMLLESIDCYRQIKNIWRASMAYITLESIISARGNASLAAGQVEMTSSFYSQLAEQQQSVVIMILEACGAWIDADETRAARLCQKIKAILEVDSQAINNPYYRAYYQFLLGRIASLRGDLDSSRKHLLEALCLFIGNSRLEVAAVLDTLGILARSQGQIERAARLFGAVAQQYDTFERLLSPRERRDYAQGLVELRQTLGEAAFQAAWEAGQAMTQEQAVAYALGEN